MNLFTTLRGAVPATGKTLLHTAAGDPISYGAMFDLAERLSGVLAGLGVVAGERVATPAGSSRTR